MWYCFRHSAVAPCTWYPRSVRPRRFSHVEPASSLPWILQHRESTEGIRPPDSFISFTFVLFSRNRHQIVCTLTRMSAPEYSTAVQSRSHERVDDHTKFLVVYLPARVFVPLPEHLLNVHKRHIDPHFLRENVASLNVFSSVPFDRYRFLAQADMRDGSQHISKKSKTSLFGRNNAKIDCIQTC